MFTIGYFSIFTHLSDRTQKEIKDKVYSSSSRFRTNQNFSRNYFCKKQKLNFFSKPQLKMRESFISNSFDLILLKYKIGRVYFYAGVLELMGFGE